VLCITFASLFFALGSGFLLVIYLTGAFDLAYIF